MTQNTVTERELEEQKLEEIIAIAQNNLDKARESIKQMDEDIAELYSTLDMDDKEGLILWNDASIRARQMKREFDRFEKARKKPYFGRIDFVYKLVQSGRLFHFEIRLRRGYDFLFALDGRALLNFVFRKE